MKGGLEVIIRGDGLTIIHGRGRTVEDFQGEDLDSGECLHGFTDKHGISSTSVNLFISEELIYATSIDLPLKTPDIADAVRFQLGLVSPFNEDDVMYSYISQRTGDMFRIIIFAARAKSVAILIEALVGAGFQVSGLYPESQRYVSGKMGKKKWALIIPDKLTKVFVFSGIVLEDRMLCNPGLDYDKMSEICGTEDLFHVSPPAGSRYQSVDELLSASPVLKDFNMLPASFRRPDYGRMVLIALLVVNIFALVFVTANKLQDLDKMIERTEVEIAEITPLVKEANDVRQEIQQSRDFLASVQALEANPDLITFLENLTNELPDASYVDQLRLDGKQKVVVIQGYTDNVGELTENLGALGETRLKSTSRRKNRTYFQVEIGLP